MAQPVPPRPAVAEGRAAQAALSAAVRAVAGAAPPPAWGQPPRAAPAALPAPLQPVPGTPFQSAAPARAGPAPGAVAKASPRTAPRYAAEASPLVPRAGAVGHRSADKAELPAGSQRPRLADRPKLVRYNIPYEYSVSPCGGHMGRGSRR